jgi:predicted acylesterase/phospholipase RssA
MSGLIPIACLAGALTLTGCFSKIQTLPPHVPEQPSVFDALSEPDTIVGIAVSGGGGRAATFAAGALEELAQIRIPTPDGEVSLLERVNYMSSVSGGSLATAYYAMKKPARAERMLDRQGLTPAYREFFAKFKADMQMNFQIRAVARQLLYFRALNPTKAAYSFADVWDDHFFDERTFADLYERERRGDSPRIIFNGTAYNTGRRLALTTLPPSDFDYDFISSFQANLARRGITMSPEGRKSVEEVLERAKTGFLPVTFEQLGASHRDLRISLAVATSASFPPVVGPVTYRVAGQTVYHHIGDGGLFDNLGTESLTTLFLKKIPFDGTSQRRGLIIVIDASFPFDAGKTELDANTKGFQVFRKDPSRVVGIMEERANAYQAMLWNSLRSQGTLLPDYDHLKLVIIRHTGGEWMGGAKDVPDACRDEFLPTVTAQELKQAVRAIPTLFRIEHPCHGALLIAGAKQAVAQQRPLIDRFFGMTK